MNSLSGLLEVSTIEFILVYLLDKMENMKITDTID